MVILPVPALCLKVFDNISADVGPGMYVSNNLLEAPVCPRGRTNTPPVHLGTPVFLESKNP